MRSKFIIVNNGMTGLRGHYYETGVSIAQEAQKRGLRTAMAAHVSCDTTALPNGLDFFPLFRVDHWGQKVATEVPGLYGLRGSLRALRDTTIEDVLEGRATMEQYLLARFEPLDGTQHGSHSVFRRALIKHLAKRVLPPILAHPVRWLVRRRHFGRQFVRSLIPPFLLDRLRPVLRGRIQGPDSAADSTRLGKTSATSVSHDLRVETHLRNALQRANATNEADLWPLFLHDLDRLLCLADVGPGDHVFLPTAHGREAFAVRRLIEEIGEERSPMFHLELRHPIATLDELDSGEQEPVVLWYTRIHQAFFDACRAYPDTNRIRYYTDTDELAADYGDLTELDFDVLPIPFRMELIPSSFEHEQPQGALKILFLGDVREEKGFQLLPSLVEALFEDYLKTGKVGFVIQASIHQDETSQVVRDALRELEKYAPKYIELFGHEGFVTPEDYYALLASSHVVLLPYLAKSYRARSSGVLAEAIAAGKPTIVTEGTWLSGQQLPGSGETFNDATSFVEAVRSVCDRYPEYKERARLARDRWQRTHSPARLMDCLLGRPIGRPNRVRATAA